MRNIALIFLIFISACQSTAEIPKSQFTSTEASSQVELDQQGALSVNTSMVSNGTLISDKNWDNFNLINQVYGQPFEATAIKLGAKASQLKDRFSVEHEGTRLYLETGDNSTVTYAQMEFENLGPCSFEKGVEASPELVKMAGLAEAKPIRANTKSGDVAYMVDGIMVETSCPNEGDYYTLAAFRLK
ncbi:MAG TPA: hypothetical protein V6D29_23395 [Leptolyngbyaceae cyanobacterium]